MKPDSADGWVVVTGAAGGIGLAVVKLLLGDGHRVLALDTSTDALSPLANERLIAKVCDVTDPSALKGLVDDAARAHAVRALVCCAAIFPAAPTLELTEESWDAVFAVNVEGVLFACQAVLPHMRAAGGGAIVVFSSTMARSGGIGAAHYSASKGAVLGLARSLALDVARDNIRVNVVSPGLTDTAQPRGNMSEEDLYARGSRIPMGRMGTAEEMAEAVRFLIGPDASFITAQDVRITGGANLF